MINKHIKVLLIEDNPGDTRLIREMLAEVGTASFDLKWADRLSSGLEQLARGGIDVLLLDLSLPDSQGLDTFTKVHIKAPTVPIIVLTSLDDGTVGVRAMREGAQDYLIKSQVDSNLLVRSIRYAIERQRLMEEVRGLSIVDELTKLHNRRGFLTLAQQQLKIANRMKRGMLLFFMDLDNMKKINDTLGHHEGDLALMEIAAVLKETFRDSDIIARIGGDEFVVLAIDIPESSAEIFTARLHENLRNRNSRGKHPYKLSISMGIAHYHPEFPCSIDELLGRADSLMYEQKWGNQMSYPKGGCDYCFD